MTEEEVNNFVYAVFEDPQQKGITKIQTKAPWPAFIRRPFYEFWCDYSDGEQSAIEYCQVLIDFFEDFNGPRNAESLSKNFSAQKKQKKGRKVRN